jgi:hypothetical protein
VHQLERPPIAGAQLIDDVHGAHAALAERTYDPEIRREDGARSELERQRHPNPRA